MQWERMPMVSEKGESIVDNVREALLECPLSRYEVAKRSGIDQAALSRFVAGGSLRVESLERLCPVLGLQLKLVRVTRAKGERSEDGAPPRRAQTRVRKS
jgi:transcriptional regulator with XRE-family HTH domain